MIYHVFNLWCVQMVVVFTTQMEYYCIPWLKKTMKGGEQFMHRNGSGMSLQNAPDFSEKDQENSTISDGNCFKK